MAKLTKWHRSTHHETSVFLLARNFSSVIFQNFRFSVSRETRFSYREARVASLDTRISYRETRLSSREKRDETGNLLLSGTVCSCVHSYLQKSTLSSFDYVS